MFYNFSMRASLFCVILLQTIICVSAATGGLDLSFGDGGKVITSISNSADFASAIAIQSDGKIVVAGYSSVYTNTDFSVVRYNSNGTLDNTFGTGGKVLTDISGGNDVAAAVAIQSDGKIIVAGNSTNNSFKDFTLVRYNTNGTLDASFGSAGKVITSFNNGNDEARAVAVQADGKIVAAGFNGSNQASEFALARYNSDGSLDASFDTDGKVTTSFGNGFAGAYALAIQSDGKIVAAGTGNRDYALARYNTDGSLDTSFDGDGKVSTSFGIFFTDVILAIAIHTDGKIVAAGSGGDYYEGAFGLARYNPDGSLDTSFDVDGKVITEFNLGGTADAVAIQSNGKIVAAGSVFTGYRGDSTLVRYNTNGSLDATFGTGGKITTSISESNSASAVAIQADGKIVVAGDTYDGTNFDFAVARYLADSNTPRTQFDFDGDGRADISVFRPSNGSWYRLNSADNSFFAIQFGLGIDRIAPADYDGDRKTDIAVYREITSVPFSTFFYILNSSNGTFRAEKFGSIGSSPAPGNWDGDERDDLAVHTPLVGIPENPPNSLFSYRPSSNPGSNAITIDASSYGISVANDYDGDGKMDAAVFRPAGGVWTIRQSSNNQLRTVHFGLSSDIPVPADFDGDGKTDIAVYRPSNGFWYFLNNSGGFDAVNFGISTDRPVPADYDGDGKADIAVYRSGIWYLLRSTAGFTAVEFGLPDDVPVPSAYLLTNQ